MQKCLLGLALSAAAALPANAVELTANAGFMSEYIFRGVPQSDSSAMGGADLKHKGFYLGTWAADLESDASDRGDGLEVDAYGGYGGTIGDFSYGVGTTFYFYTDDFDDDYREINLNGGYKLFSIAVAVGEYDNFDGPTLDYTYIAPRIDYKGFYALFGTFSQDFDGEYYEAGYGANFEPIDLDYRISLVYSSDDLLGDADGDGEPDDDTSVVFSISKTFDILD
jgi:uncharacterized protein (TIGR02001 family)